MFGVMNDHVLATMDSFGQTFNMPYVTTSEPGGFIPPAPDTLEFSPVVHDHSGKTIAIRTPDVTARPQQQFAIYLRPLYHRPLVALAQYYQWSKVFYVYDSNQGQSVLYSLATCSLEKYNAEK